MGILTGKTLLDTGHDDLGQLAFGIGMTGSFLCLLTFSLRMMLVDNHREKNGLNLRSHKGKLVVDMALDDLGIDNEAGGNVVCVPLE